MKFCSDCGREFSAEDKFCSGCGRQKLEGESGRTLPKRSTPKKGTPPAKRSEILAEVWSEYRDEPYFEDFFEYADLGLPLAFLLSSKMVAPTKESDELIRETWELFLGVCGHGEDEGFDDLKAILDGLDLTDV